MRRFLVGLITLALLVAPASSQMTLTGIGNGGVGGSAASEGTVTLDSATTSLIPGGNVYVGTNSATFPGTSLVSLNVGITSTSNLCLVLVVAFVNATGSVPTSVVWDPGGTAQTMTLIPSASTADVYLYYQMAPTTGQHDVTVTWSGVGANGISVVGASFYNVDQTGGTTTFPNVATNTGAASGTPTVSITTSPTTRKIVAGFVSTQASFTGPVNGADLGFHSAGVAYDFGGSYDNGTATSMAYAGTGTGAWQAVAAAVKGN